MGCAVESPESEGAACARGGEPLWRRGAPPVFCWSAQHMARIAAEFHHVNLLIP